MVLGCARECAKGWWSYAVKVFTDFFTPEMCGSLYVRLYGILHICAVLAREEIDEESRLE